MLFKEELEENKEEEEVASEKSEVNASHFEHKLDLDQVSQKEVPTSTSDDSVSPAYKLIKEAFAEFQLFSKACKCYVF